MESPRRVRHLAFSIVVDLFHRKQISANLVTIEQWTERASARASDRVIAQMGDPTVERSRERSR